MGVPVRARVREVRGLVVVGRDRGGVAAARAAVRLEREALQLGRALGVLVVGDAVGERGGLLLRGGRVRGGLLGAVAGEHRLDVVAVPDGEEHLVAVETGGVALGLGDLLHLDAHRVQRVEEGLLEVLGPRGVAVPGVGDGAQRTADVLGVRRVDAHGHLAEAVVVVPHVQVPHGHPAAAQLVGDEVHGEELAHVAQVDPARRRDARRHGHLLAFAGVPDGVVGGAGDPVGRRGGHAARRYRRRRAVLAGFRRRGRCEATAERSEAKGYGRAPELSPESTPALVDAPDSTPH